MPSPFPGMNPYLEQDGVWPDLHHRLITAFANQLGQKVRPGFIVTIGQDVYLHVDVASERLQAGKSDVSIVTVTTKPMAVATANSVVAAGLPGLLDLEPEKDELGVVEVRDRETREVVTVIEVLSPSNKYAGRDRDQYLRKRFAYLTSQAHFLEIDLLRGGPRMPCKGMPPCDYVMMLSRAQQRPHVELFPFGLHDPIRPVPVPLRPPREDVVLDVRAAIDDVYDLAAYEDYIYAGQPHPGLRAEDQLWARHLIESTVKSG